MKYIIVFGIIMILSFANPVRTQTNFWEQTNGPCSGNVQAILIDSDGNIFAGGSEFGMFKSTNGGSEWIEATNGISNFYVLSIGNNVAGEIFAGTYDTLYRSTNLGETWEPTNLTNFITNHIVLNSQNHIFVASNFGGGISRSTDNGDTWQTVNNGLTSLEINDLTLTQSDQLFAVSDSGIFKSTNNGDNWIPKNTGLTNTKITSVTINSPGNIFIGLEDFLSNGGVYRSTDSGESWQLVVNGLTDSTVIALGNNPNGYIYAATSDSGIFRSGDNGDNWDNVGIKYAEVNTIYSKYNDEIFIGTSQAGIINTIDNGETWMCLGFPFSSVQDMQIMPSGKIYAVCDDGSGVQYSVNSGKSWINITSDLPGFSVRIYSIAANNLEHLFIGKFQDGIYKSTNNGYSWFQSGLQWAEQITRILILNNGYIFAGALNSGVWRSTDNGNTWEQSLANTYVNCIELDAINGGILVGSGSSGGVWRSMDNGTNWTRLGLEGIIIYSVVVNSDGHIYAASVEAGVKKIYRSTNNGVNWNLMNSGSINGLIVSLAASSSGQLYAGTVFDNVGIYTSTDGGITWIELNSGLYHQNVYRLSINQENYIFATTEGGGIYKSVNPIVTDLSMDQSNSYTFNLKQNYPNPFNPSTTINFSLPTSGFATLKIYNALGEEVKVLLDKELTTGTYELEWNATGLPSGIYFYKLQAGSFVETKKMVLMK